MPVHVKDAGQWREAVQVFVKDAGQWREVVQAFVKDAGQWREVAVMNEPRILGEPVVHRVPHEFPQWAYSVSFEVGGTTRSVKVEYRIGGGAFSVLDAFVNTTTVGTSSTVLAGADDPVMFRMTPYPVVNAVGVPGPAVISSPAPE